MSKFALCRVSVILSTTAFTFTLNFVAVAPKAQGVGASPSEMDIIEQDRVVAFDKKTGKSPRALPYRRR